MKRPFYLFNAGRMSRKDNTLCFVAVNEAGEEQPAKYLPIETINELFAFGALDANSAIYNFLGQHHVPVHFFDYYGHYTGSFMSRDYLLAGRVQIAQTQTFLTHERRMTVAQAFVDGASFNMLKNLRYYDNRGREMEPFIERIETYRQSIPLSKEVPELMGLEGNCRSTYYDAFDLIINDFEMGNRSKQPPSNEVNALISFGNMLCYTLALSQIYHTQLNPTISFLHEPGERRYSLALDVAEIFKPILVDRIIFKLLNKKEIQAKDFDKNLNGCRLSETGKKIFAKEWDTKLNETIKHRAMNKQVSYRHLVKLECYKLQKYILGIESVYKPLKMYW
jgi:CRISPR-associated protein Cas1